MNIWQVQLEGDVFDIEFLENVLAASPRKVLRDEEGQGYIYESDSFNLCTTSEEVERFAEGELAILSGILKLERNARDVLRYGSVYRRNSSGGRDIFVRIHESLLVRSEMNSVTIVVTDSAGNVIDQAPPPPPRSLVLVQLAAEDAAIAKVLRLLSGPEAMTWVGLYRIREVIDDDVGRQHKLKKQGWGSAGDLKRFTHSANSVQVGGDKSRHGKDRQVPPKNPMTLVEAQAYVKYIVQSWLASKGA